MYYIGGFKPTWRHWVSGWIDWIARNLASSSRLTQMKMVKSLSHVNLNKFANLDNNTFVIFCKQKSVLRNNKKEVSHKLWYFNLCLLSCSGKSDRCWERVVWVRVSSCVTSHWCWVPDRVESFHLNNCNLVGFFCHNLSLSQTFQHFNANVFFLEFFSNSNQFVKLCLTN